MTIGAWPDGVQLTLLRHLGGPRQVQGYLHPYRLLCRSCAEASLAPALWRDIDLSCIDQSFEGGALLGLISRCAKGVVERFILRGVEGVNDSTLEGLAEILQVDP